MRVVSTAFCCLYKLMTLHLTREHLREVLDCKDNPYIRAIGFLFLRYTCPPTDIWGWIEPYLDDDEEFNPSANKTAQKMCTPPLLK